MITLISMLMKMRRNPEDLMYALAIGFGLFVIVLGVIALIGQLIIGLID
jgi:hypothetical protein